MQSNALESSGKAGPVSPPSSRVLRHFSTIAKRHCCALKPFGKPKLKFGEYCLKIWIDLVILMYFT